MYVYIKSGYEWAAYYEMANLLTIFTGPTKKSRYVLSGLIVCMCVCMFFTCVCIYKLWVRVGYV